MDPPDNPNMFIGLLMIRHNGAFGDGYGSVFPIPIRRKTLEAYRSNILQLAATELALGEVVPRPLTIENLAQRVLNLLQSRL